MMAHRNSQGEALRIEGACRTRDIHDTQQFAIGRVVDRNGSAGPPLNLRTEMLCTANLNRFRFRYRGANGVGANVGLAPASSVFQMNRTTGVNDPVIALGIYDQSGGIGQDQD